jgi:uncharacterized protein (TIGR02217 family)
MVIRKPVAGTVRVAIDGDRTAEGWLDAGRVGRAVTFDTPPPAGATITAGFEFDVPVRFDTDLIQVSLASFAAGEIPKIPVIEVRL